MKAKVRDISIISRPGNGPSRVQFLISTLCDFDQIYFEHAPGAHRHDFYSIFWIRRGKLLHTVDHHAYQAEGDCLFLLAPGQVHQMTFAGKAEGWLIAFSDSFLCLKDGDGHEGINCSLFFNKKFNSLIRVDKRQSRALEQVVGLMKAEAECSGDHHEEAFHDLLKYFLILVSRMMENQGGAPSGGPAGNSSSVFMEFRRMIEEHYASHRKVSDNATLLHIGAAQLNEISREVSGIPAGEHLRNRVVLEAKRWLRHSDLSSKQIAYKLGFEDPHYFSRFFKKQTGQSPLEFKFMARQESSLIE